MNNWQLYPRALHEFARTSRVNTGRACLLTYDHKCMLRVGLLLSKYRIHRAGGKTVTNQKVFSTLSVLGLH